MSPTIYDIMIAVIIAFAVVLMVTIAVGTATGITKFVVIPLIFSGTAVAVLKIADYRNNA